MKFSEDRGSALIEFIGFGLLFQIAVLTAIIIFGQNLEDKMIAEAVARHSLRSFMLTGTPVDISAKEVVSSWGEATPSSVSMKCIPDCQSKDSRLEVTVTIGSASSRSVIVR